MDEIDYSGRGRSYGLVERINRLIIAIAERIDVFEMGYGGKRERGRIGLDQMHLPIENTYYYIHHLTCYASFYRFALTCLLTELGPVAMRPKLTPRHFFSDWSRSMINMNMSMSLANGHPHSEHPNLHLFSSTSENHLLTIT